MKASMHPSQKHYMYDLKDDEYQELYRLSVWFVDEGALPAAKRLFDFFRRKYYEVILDAVMKEPIVSADEFFMSGGNYSCIYEGWNFENPLEQKIVETIWQPFVGLLIDKEILRNCHIVPCLFSLEKLNK